MALVISTKYKRANIVNVYKVLIRTFKFINLKKPKKLLSLLHNTIIFVKSASCYEA